MSGLDMVCAAMHYARMGWPVFPCWPGRKTPIGPLVPHGCLEATTELTTICRWWGEYSEANIGIACGAPGPDVIDVDVKNDSPGEASYLRLSEAGLLRGAFAIITTPSGGWHLHYQGTAQSNSTRKRHGIDFRSKGGYVLAPPSVVDGRRYAVREWRAPTGLSVSWSAILAFLEPPRAGEVSRQVRRTLSADGGDYAELIAWMGKRTEGSRNSDLFWAACRVVETGGDERALALLADAAATTGLDQIEISRTVASAQRKVRGARV